jgi:hypothetical protein
VARWKSAWLNYEFAIFITVAGEVPTMVTAATGQLLEETNKLRREVHVHCKGGILSSHSSMILLTTLFPHYVQCLK